MAAIETSNLRVRDASTYLSPWCWNFQGSVRDDRVRRSKVWWWLTSLHSIFLGRQTALVLHRKVAEQPAVSASSSGLPWPAAWSHEKRMDDWRLALAGRGRAKRGRR